MLRNAIRGLCREAKDTVETAKQDYEANSEEFSLRFREQNQQHAQNMFVIRDQYKKLSQVFTAKKEALDDRLQKDTDRLKQMHAKRKLDLEGYGSDLSNLKKRMVFYQNYIGKLKKLVDRDQESGEMSNHAHALFGMDENDIIIEQANE